VRSVAGVGVVVTGGGSGIGAALCRRFAAEGARVVVNDVDGDAGRFLILPHPEVAGLYAGRAAESDRWLRGMSELQQRLEDLAWARSPTRGRPSRRFGPADPAHPLPCCTTTRTSS
jgi:NAD(P)-dependent dehydrogenase (short-subunit alcohol dehydrogenase family)